MAELVSLVLGYLLGSFDFAVLAARRRGIDIFAEGSGNPGATNVMRVMGRGAGAVVMAVDLGKGIAAAAIGEMVGGSELVGFAAGAMAVVGHCYPVWHRFRGGKGVATTLGMLIWTIPLMGLVLGAMWLSVVVVTRVSSFGSLTIVVLSVPGVAIWAEDRWSAVIMAAVAVLIFYRHRANIERMFRGEEQGI